MPVRHVSQVEDDGMRRPLDVGQRSLEEENEVSGSVEAGIDTLLDDVQVSREQENKSSGSTDAGMVTA